MPAPPNHRIAETHPPPAGLVPVEDKIRKMMPTAFSPHILALRQRINCVACRDAVLRGAFVTALAAVLIAIIFVVQGLRVDHRWLAAAIPAGVLAAGIHWQRRRVNPYVAAARADHILGLNDTLITAYRSEQEQRSTPFHLLQREQACELLLRQDTAPLTPPFSRPIAAGIILAAILVFALALLPDTPANATRKRQGDTIAGDTRAINAELLAAVANVEDLPAEARQLLAQTKIKTAAEKLMATTDLSKALQQYTELERQIRESIAQTDIRRDEAVLAKMAANLENDPLGKNFAQTLKQQDYKLSAAELENIRKKTVQAKTAAVNLANLKKLAAELLAKIEKRDSLSATELAQARRLATELDAAIGESGFTKLSPLSRDIVKELAAAPPSAQNLAAAAGFTSELLKRLNGVGKKRLAQAQAKNRMDKLGQLDKTLKRMQDACDDADGECSFKDTIANAAKLSEKARRALQKLLENGKLQDGDGDQDGEAEPLSPEELAELEKQLEELEDALKNMDEKLGELGDKLRLLQAQKALRQRLLRMQGQLAGAQGRLLGRKPCASPSGKPGGGIGAQAGDKPGAPKEGSDSANAATPNTRINGLKGQGPSSKQVQDAQSGSGVSSNPGGGGTPADFQAQIEALIRREDVPSELKDGVKSYFNIIHQAPPADDPGPVRDGKETKDTK